MDIPLALLADYANVSQEGKLNVMGIFNRINAASFPCVHSEMTLVIRGTAGAGERGLTKRFEVRLLDQDGNVKLDLQSEIVVPDVPGVLTPEMTQMIRISDVAFDRPGRYSFRILVNGEEKTSVDFEVSQAVGPSQSHP